MNGWFPVHAPYDGHAAADRDDDNRDITAFSHVDDDTDKFVTLPNFYASVLVLLLLLLYYYYCCLLPCDGE